MAGSFGAPYRAPCGGWPANPKYGWSSIYHHQTNVAKTIQKWNNTTKVLDWRCPPTGVQSNSCNPGTDDCNPDSGYDPTGIYPYPRVSDSGGGNSCGDHHRCDTDWPANGNCPGPCGGPCHNVPGNAKCNAWIGTALANTPHDLISCSTPDATHQTIDFNCYTEEVGVAIDRSVCRKIGFKNVQAQKTWHGRFGYESHDLSGGQQDDSYGFEGAPCSGQNIEYEQTSPDSTKYLNEVVACVFNDVTAGKTATAQCTVSINRYSGVATATPTISGDNVVRDNAANLVGVHGNSRKDDAWGFALALLTSAIGAGSTYTGLSHVGTNFFVQIQDPANGNFIYLDVTINFATGNATINWYDDDSSIPPAYPEGTMTWTFTNTAFTIDYNVVAAGTGGHGHYTVTGALSSAYTAANAWADTVAASAQWDIDDDEMYPWRTDEYCGAAPLCSYSEPSTATTPSTFMGVSLDGGFNVIPITDPNALLFNGALGGAPNGLPGAPGHFDFHHKTIRACCGDGDTIGLYNYAYGATSGSEDAPAFDPTDIAMPRTATRWTENYDKDYILPFSQCGSDFTCPGLPPSGDTSMPCTFSPGHLPMGAWVVFDGNLIRMQKWAEIKVVRASYNYGRPCGNDKYKMVESTVRCVQSGGTTGGLTVSSATAIASTDKVLVCGCGTIADGTYTATKTGATNYTLASFVAFAGGYSPINCGTGIIGKLRYPSAAACSGDWNDDQPKGDYLVASWDMSLRDYVERDRVVAQYAACASCAAAAPASSTLIRQYQAGHGMPREVKTLTITAECLAYDHCNPQVICITPNGESFTNGHTTAFPSFVADGRYGAMWQAAVIQAQDDYLWETPHKICVTSGGVQVLSGCTWTEDDGTCASDVCVEPTGTSYYAHRPLVEARKTPPGGAPALPGDATPLYYLTLADLDTGGGVPGGYILPPPIGPGYDSPDAFNLMFPIPNETIWGTYIREIGCVCTSGRFGSDYLADGVKCL